jgi:hypothetical protein
MTKYSPKILHCIRTPTHGADYAHFDKQSTTLVISVGLSGGNEKVCKIRFPGAEMFNFRSEPFSVGFPSESYDAICELTDTDWVKTFDRRSAHVRELRHFAVYVSNSGYIEIASEAMEVGYE